MASNDKTAGGLTARINQRHLFADWTRKKKAAQLGIQTPLLIQTGSGATKQASIFNYIADGAQFTTAAEQSQYLASVSLPGSTTPTYTTFYEAFTAAESTTWTAPATIQSPITYWIVGGGGGGAGAYDQRGNGGGGGGAAITGTYAVVAGTTYTIVVGAGGAGGEGQGSAGASPGDTDGADGTDSSFDSAGGGPVAAGGGKGLDGTTGTPSAGGTGGIVTTGGNGGGGGASGGGGGGAGGNGTNGILSGVGPFVKAGGIGGIGVSFTIPGYNGGNAQVYGAGGDGGANPSSGFAVGASGLANTGKGGGGGSAVSFAPDPGRRMGGNGGSGLVVIQYSA
jgi:hypothetical protein